jgi:hypothetical protein
VIDNVDRVKFQETLAPVFAELGKRFKATDIERIRNYK